MDPFTIALASAGIGAAGSVASGYLANKNSGQETKIQKKQRKLVDQLLASLEGNGPYSDLYNMDEAAFQKSFVDPAKHMFNNQIAPQIQQQYIANGQQNGTGLDDTLTRAGVDLDSILNQHYADYQNKANDRKQNTINSILNQNSGGTQGGSNQQALASGTAGYLSSDSFKDAINSLSKNYQSPNQNIKPARKGFEDDYYTPYQSTWRQ